jgi:ribosome-binding factor A
VVSKLRLDRIGQRIREELSTILLMEVADPRLDGVSVTDVRVDRELAYADIYISALEGAERWPEIKEGLERAANFLRRQLSQRIELRSFPRLRFRWDATYEKAERIEQLFAELHKDDEARKQATDQSDAFGSDAEPSDAETSDADGGPEQSPADDEHHQGETDEGEK